MRNKLLVVAIIALFFAAFGETQPQTTEAVLGSIPEGGGEIEQQIYHPLSVELMRTLEYETSEIVIEEELDRGSNYRRYLASYTSDGNKNFAMLTVPDGDVPEGGFPGIVFNHGWIAPSKYRTTERYVAYLDTFARSGYVVIKPDYRGHGSSEGQASSAYLSPNYTRDVMVATRSLAALENVNPENIGMWGHSMGGAILLRTMVTTDDISVGVVWAGVVAEHQDLYLNWRQDLSTEEREELASSITPEVEEIMDTISPINFVDQISGPVQIHHGTSDSSVPWEFSESLKNVLEEKGLTHEYYLYNGADHNLSGAAFGPAATRSVEFFDRYLK